MVFYFLDMIRRVFYHPSFYVRSIRLENATFYLNIPKHLYNKIDS
jgi:hypothetical protein